MYWVLFGIVLMENLTTSLKSFWSTAGIIKKRLCLVDSTPYFKYLRFKNRGGLLYMTNFKILQPTIQMPMHFNQGASHFMGLALDTKNVWGIALDWSFFLEEG